MSHSYQAYWGVHLAHQNHYALHESEIDKKNKNKKKLEGIIS